MYITQQISQKRKGDLNFTCHLLSCTVVYEPHPQLTQIFFRKKSAAYRHANVVKLEMSQSKQTCSAIVLVEQSKLEILDVFFFPRHSTVCHYSCRLGCDWCNRACPIHCGDKSESLPQWREVLLEPH